MFIQEYLQYMDTIKNKLLEIHQIQCKNFLKPIKAKLLAMAMIDQTTNKKLQDIEVRKFIFKIYF